MTRHGFIVASSQTEADRIAQARPDLVHKSLRQAQDWRRDLGEPADQVFVVQMEEEV